MRRFWRNEAGKYAAITLILAVMGWLLILAVVDRSESTGQYEHLSEIPELSACHELGDIGPVNVLVRRSSYQTWVYIKGHTGEAEIGELVRQAGIQAERASELRAEESIDELIRPLPSSFADGLEFSSDDLFIYGGLGSCDWSVRGAYAPETGRVLLMFTR